ncbi:hydroxyethylthiazole kinase-like uncharacterized protein yjeF [Microbacterium endophyticum]|uniref:ADP-dependent (S)-NAD(P)H-hydrate dehydratase n=1 Tax=Microbacterium endophyticum TaxID=1526412 RepID=A0A7W4YMB0_9MICO|nr:ADP/ATP-dependent (S)-NAD(P)H-hydrate dehydratase [Microbacterium endophyticum]MBB2976285.1 hydroxyethylthiazole kinase-like uncharacterized protein yjeF [Microbacterium endophyticum]NIK35165.1 hydroxyethylthiazole kinase-like uncharacterized protein yjeF [Microbacterium endophyticum]
MSTVRTWTASDAAGWIRRPVPSDDKYSRGVVGIRTGSAEYPGAAVLGVEAAWRAGTGMVRYIGAQRAIDLVLARRPETVTAAGRVQAWVIGSGTDAASRSDQETDALRGTLSGAVPVVVDAGALDLSVGATAPRIVTPHGREHDRLRQLLGLAPTAVGDSVAERTDAAVQTARALGATVLLKGSTTLITSPSGAVIEVEAGVPWLATAGTGDVLAGIMGALVASHSEQIDNAAAAAAVAATAAWVHGRAGAVASARLGLQGGPITALDVADATPTVIAELLTR